MNFRALLLLAAFLLMQAGSAWAVTPRCDPTEAALPPCKLRCCEEDMGASGCCCAENPPAAPVPATPAPPPPHGREVVPQVAWTTAVALPRLPAPASDEAKIYPYSAMVSQMPTVSLTVLHCAFLI